MAVRPCLPGSTVNIFAMPNEADWPISQSGGSQAHELQQLPNELDPPARIGLDHQPASPEVQGRMFLLTHGLRSSQASSPSHKRIRL